MAANSPSGAERGFVSEQVVYGVTLRYDQAGQITANSLGIRSHGDFGQSWIRWNQTGEAYLKVLSVRTLADKKVEIWVTGHKYQIDSEDRTFKRAGSAGDHPVSELLIKDDVNSDGEKSVIDVFPACGEGDDSIFIIAEGSSTYRYRYNQATGQWERVCT